MWVSLAFLAGILLASLVSLPTYIWLALSVLAVVGVIVARRLPSPLQWPDFGNRVLRLSSSTVVLALACLSLGLLGAARYQSAAASNSGSSLAYFNDGGYDALVTGVLIQPPDARDTYTNLRLQAQTVDTGLDQVKVKGLLLARVAPNQQYHYGDILRLRGELQTPPENEDFSYRDYLARQGIRSYMSSAEVTLLPAKGGSPLLAAMYSLRDSAFDHVYRLFLDPEASLLAGILLGVDSGLPAQVEQAFNNTGTSHIIAISGFNIAVIAGVLAFLFGRALGPRRGALAALTGIVFYTLFVGADPAVVRAALMGAVTLLAIQVGRRQQGLNTLAFVAALMALGNPFVLWDVGFQLSLFATLGLILYGTPFMEAVEGFLGRHLAASDARRVASFLGDVVLLTLAAQLTTLPIVAYHFRQVSLVSPLANAFILPVQPAVMVLGGLAVAISFAYFPLGQLLAWVAWPFTAYTIRVVEFFDSVPHTVIYLGGLSLAFVVLYYAVLLGVTFGHSRFGEWAHAIRLRFRYVSVTGVIVALFVVSLFAWRLVAAAPDGRLHITFLDVGSADAVLIQTPAGRHVLIDGGPSAAAASDALGRRLSPLDHSLDWLVLASTDENQVASLPRLVQRFPPRNVLLGAQAQASFSSGSLMQWLIDEEVPVIDAQEGQTLDLGDGARLRVIGLSPRGATLLVEWDMFRMLLPIGANTDTLARLEDGDLAGQVDVLSLSQSGYAPLTPPELLPVLNPDLVVISVAAADKDGLPSAETIDAVQGYSVLRTDVNGWVEVTTDGQQMWVSAERLPPEEGTPSPASSDEPSEAVTATPGSTSEPSPTTAPTSAPSAPAP
jgi:competence protein ComEC